MSANAKNILKISIIVTGISLLFAFLTALAEKDVQSAFWDFENLLWWWLTTVSTVGYGDLVPKTALGKIFASVVIFSSFIFLVLVVSELNYLIKNFSNKKNLGIATINKKGHIVILGYNSMANVIIEHFKKTELGNNILLVTDVFQSNQFEGIDLLNGDPRSMYVLNRAKIVDSKAVIILSDENINNPDAYTLVIASEVERLNPDIFSIAELTDIKYRPIFEDADIDYFITEEALVDGLFNEKVLTKLLDKVIKKNVSK